MAVRTNPDGVTLQFCDKNGTPQGEPVFGHSAHTYSKDNKHITQSAPLTAAEAAFPGSEDWLTVLAVADTPAKLEHLLTGQEKTSFFSSASSRRVLVLTHIGHQKEMHEAQLTIATGKPAMHHGKEVFLADSFMVLPADTAMNEKHPLISKWIEMTPHLALTSKKGAGGL